MDLALLPKPVVAARVLPSGEKARAQTGDPGTSIRIFYFPVPVSSVVRAVDVMPARRYLVTLQHQVTVMVNLITWRGSAVGSTCVVGLQWGDEAKGKIVDLLCDGHDVVVRIKGGPMQGTRSLSTV